MCHCDRLIRSKQFPSLDPFHYQIVLVEKKKLHTVGLHWHGPPQTICSLQSICSPYDSNTSHMNLSICKGEKGVLLILTIHMEKAEVTQEWHMQSCGGIISRAKKTELVLVEFQDCVPNTSNYLILLEPVMMMSLVARFIFTLNIKDQLAQRP